MTFSNDGSVILVGMTNGKVKAIDVQSRRTVAELKDASEAIDSVSVSPSEALLVIATRSGTLYLYQVEERCRRFSRVGRCMVNVVLTII